MKVEICVKVGGGMVKQFTEEVDGTLEEMEEKIHTLSESVACTALQASVDAASEPRPLFRRTADGFVIKEFDPER